METFIKVGKQMTDLKKLEEATNLLGLYKAEWLSKKLFEYFSEPGYFSLLKTERPCVLIGGRGTGKTTVLKGLSYEGQLALSEHINSQPITEWNFFGIYYRVNTNRVTAFKGSELTQDLWNKYFAHYINLVFCLELLSFSLWFEENANIKLELGKVQWRNILKSLHIDLDITNITELHEEVEIQLIEFENSINDNINEIPQNLTLQAAPIDVLTESLLSTNLLKDKQFYFIIDEFENFEDYQQKIINTMIKHSNDYYTFKIGVRELGYRERGTLNAHEHLISPADYVRIDLNQMFENDFPNFAKNVINSRLNLDLNDQNFDISDLLISLTYRQEAEKLIGTDEPSYLTNFCEKLSPNDKGVFLTAPLGYKYFIYHLSKDNKINVSELLEQYKNNDKKWKDKLNNYFYASLFAIKQGKSGMKKYYCGWDTFVSMSHYNIRYLLELVHTTLQDYLSYCKDNKKEISFSDGIDSTIQTNAAIKVGKKNLSEIEGLTVDGAKLKKLLLSLGRIFGILAAKPHGHAPELNQFEVKNLSTDTERVNKILMQAVMHLALVRFTGSKLLIENDIKDDDFMIHPIFSAFFVISYRRKRKFNITPENLMLLIDKPQEGINNILRAYEEVGKDIELPDQMRLFEDFYE